jgi:hypothetical protein
MPNENKANEPYKAELVMTNLACLVPPHELTRVLRDETGMDDHLAMRLIEEYGPGLFHTLNEECALIALTVLWGIETVLARKVQTAA